MTMQVILALDIGSSSTRCSAYEIVDNGNATVKHIEGCFHQAQIRSVQPNSGKIAIVELLVEIDTCMDKTLEALRRKSGFRVVALGFSTFVMNLVGVDDNGQVVGSEATLSYACNAPEVAQECRSLEKRLTAEQLDELYRKTGAPLHSAYALAQLRALYSSSPLLVKRISKWQTIASICLARWTGQSATAISYSEASWTGLLNVSTCQWEQSAIDLLPHPCRDALPSLQDYGDLDMVVTEYIEKSATRKKNPYWERWSDLREMRLFLGIGDGACANIGSKCIRPTRIAVTVGTSAAARICLPHAKGDASLQVPPGLFCYRIDESHVLVGGALTDGGSVVEFARSLLNLSSNEAFQDCMQQVETLIEEEPASSFAVIPFLSGERSTGFRDGATGCVFGLTRETTPAHFLKGCMEGVILRIKAVLLLIQEIIPDHVAQPIIVVSGSAMEKNVLWRQMLADASGMNALLDKDVRESTSRGVARLVAISLLRQRDDDSDSLVSEEPIFSPTVSKARESATEGYWAKSLEAQDALITAMSPLW